MKRILLALAMLFCTAEAHAAITFFGSASVPAHNGTNTSTPAAITPPASMLANDYVVVIATMFRSPSDTMSVSQAGGQTWTSETQQTPSTNFHTRVFHTRFNGTWSANPSFTVTGGTGGAAYGAVMLVFRGVDTTTALDVALAHGTFSVGSASNVTITGINTTTNDAVVVAFWDGACDSLTWTLQTGGWSQDQANWRNDAGSDYTVAYAHKEVDATGSGNVVNATSRACSGGTTIFALKAASSTRRQHRTIIVQ